jgi:hypothetical protein
MLGRGWREGARTAPDIFVWKKPAKSLRAKA